jgi:hypothetical protein
MSLYKRDMVPVGTIVPSMLDWEEFKNVLGKEQDEWLPADGRDAPAKSEYYRIKNSGAAVPKLPDLRGRFIRGLNLFAEDYGAISGEQLGNPDQEDSDGNSFISGSYQADAVGPHQHSIPTRSGDITGQPYVSEGIDHEQEDVWTDKTTPVALETRPRNVSLYFYIKVD